MLNRSLRTHSNLPKRNQVSSLYNTLSVVWWIMKWSKFNKLLNTQIPNSLRFPRSNRPHYDPHPVCELWIFSDVFTTHKSISSVLTLVGLQNRNKAKEMKGDSLRFLSRVKFPHWVTSCCLCKLTWCIQLDNLAYSPPHLCLADHITQLHVVHTALSGSN